jgi:hypothetical protein
MAAYTYLACDLMTNAILAELPLSSVSYENRLNGAGTFTGALMLGDPRVAAIDPIGSTQEARTALYVKRDNRLVWGGILWTRRYDSNTKLLQLGGQEFWSYFAHRIIVPPSLGQIVYLATDQIVIATFLLNNAMGVPGGNPGSKATPPSGFQFAGQLNCGGVAGLVDFQAFDYELKTVSSEVETLAQAQAGFDFAVDVAFDANGNPAKYITFNYPRRGIGVGNSGLVFDSPGNIMSYQWPEDGTKMANSVYLYGAGAGNTMLRASQADPSLLDAGYPLLDTSSSYKGTTSQGVLNSFVTAELTAYRVPLTLPVLEVNPAQDPVLGSYTVGDECRVRITDERFPVPNNVIDAPFRIVGIKVQPQETQVETVTLTLTNPWTG